MKLEWNKTSEILPEKDGTYEICNHPTAENDAIRREMTATAYYDGFGFQYLGVYRIPEYWREPKIFSERRYGKVIK